MISAQRPAEGDYLPARMLNEFVYCPRLFYYEYVEGVFAHNRETVEGALRHDSLDQREDGLPSPEQLAESDRPVRARSISLASDRFGVIAKLDIVEADGGEVTPVDYKRGRRASCRTARSVSGNPTKSSWRCRRSYCARMVIVANRRSCTMSRPDSACG